MADTWFLSWHAQRGLALCTGIVIVRMERANCHLSAVCCNLKFELSFHLNNGKDVLSNFTISCFKWRWLPYEAEELSGKLWHLWSRWWCSGSCRERKNMCLAGLPLDRLYCNCERPKLFQLLFIHTWLLCLDIEWINKRTCINGVGCNLASAVVIGM